MNNRLEREKRKKHSIWIGMLIAGIGYFILSFQQPNGWETLLWLFLGFLLIPSIAGFSIGKRMGSDTESKIRFTQSFLVIGFMMWLYTIINMMMVRSHVNSSADSGAIFMVGMFVSSIYSTIAGLVAGAASSLLVRG